MIYFQCSILKDIIVNIIQCIIGYLPVAIATAVYTYHWTEPLVKVLQSDVSSDSPYYEKFQHSLQRYPSDFIIPVIFMFVSSIPVYSANFTCMGN